MAEEPETKFEKDVTKLEELLKTWEELSPIPLEEAVSSLKTLPVPKSTIDDLLPRGITSAATGVGETKGEARVAKNPWTIIEGLVQRIVGELTFPGLLALLALGFLFYQDNKAGMLTSWMAIGWTALKSGSFFVIACVILSLDFFWRKFRRKTQSWKTKSRKVI